MTSLPVVQWQLLWSHALPHRQNAQPEARRKGGEYRKKCMKQPGAVIVMPQNSVDSRCDVLMNGCSYLCTPAQRGSSYSPDTASPFFSGSFFGPVIRRDYIASALHSYTHSCRPLTYAAALALTGRAPAVLLLLHVLLVSTDSLTRATTAAP